VRPERPEVKVNNRRVCAAQTAAKGQPSPVPRHRPLHLIGRGPSLASSGPGFP
jgi:hypothetical protein